MNMMEDYEKAKNQNAWTWQYSLSAPRLRRLIATRNTLRSRVADFMGVDVERLRVKKPPVRMEHSKITLLRVLQVWVFSKTLIDSIQAADTSTDGAVTVSLTGENIMAKHLEQILDPQRHPFAIVSNREIVQNGSFVPITDDDRNVSMAPFLSEFEGRFVSYGVEKSIDVFWYSTDEGFYFFAPKRVVESHGFAIFCKTRLARFNESDLTAQLTGRRRGAKERPCGLWDVRPSKDDDQEEEGLVQLTKWSCAKKTVASELGKILNKQVLHIVEITSALSCTFTKSQKKKGKRVPSFSLISCGRDTEVSKTDICDLFATPNVTVKTKENK